MRGIFKTLVPVALLPTAALAHQGHGEVSTLLSGVLHPLTGVDHLLAMVALGAVAVLGGARKPWLLPIGFLAAMLSGAALGMAGASLPAVEAMILASVILLGLIVVLPAQLIAQPLVLAASVIFGLAHGFAHGVEAPIAGSLLGYGVGFVAMSTALIATGAALARKLPNVAIRSGGVAVLLAGLGLVLAA